MTDFWGIMARFIATVFLGLLALVALVAPGAVTHTTGFHRLGTPSADRIGQRDASEDRSSPRFLAERNRLTLTVNEAMSLGEFVSRYQISTAYVRGQIAQQLGSPERAADDQLMIPAGQQLEIYLTEVAQR